MNLCGTLFEVFRVCPISLVKSDTGAKPKNKWLEFTYDWQDKRAGKTLSSLHELDLPYLCGGRSLPKALGLDDFIFGVMVVIFD